MLQISVAQHHIAKKKRKLHTAETRNEGKKDPLELDLTPQPGLLLIHFSFLKGSQTKTASIKMTLQDISEHNG